VTSPIYKCEAIGSVAKGSQDCAKLVQLPKQDVISPIYKGTRISGVAAETQDCAVLV
jgi:hypothetical protein